MSYETHVVLDFEFNPTAKSNRYILRQEIIEIGAVKLNSRLEEIGRFSCYVCPELAEHITPDITRLTGIRDTDVMHAESFEAAIALFSAWIGNEKCRIYSWSSSDLRQLEDECWIKNVEFPHNMHRWMDLQKVWQRLIRYPHSLSMSLRFAAEQAGIVIDESKAHRAVYDSEITAGILRRACSEEFRSDIKKAKNTITAVNTHSTYSISNSSCGSALQELMLRLKSA